jgi:hypothetical protein
VCPAKGFSQPLGILDNHLGQKTKLATEKEDKILNIQQPIKIKIHFFD